MKISLGPRISTPINTRTRIPIKTQAFPSNSNSPLPPPNIYHYKPRTALTPNTHLVNSTPDSTLTPSSSSNSFISSHGHPHLRPYPILNTYSYIQLFLYSYEVTIYRVEYI
ncbi:hypothetical protein GYMLUDRAFT_935163 [Collybiopsis luxurians FD-317 M1]|nr:hypothetical protein GYMLUDRAFT_935163 [Collybiopsis luxurians FD-317 M1]